MADKKIQLKRNNAGTIDNMFPVARIGDIVQSDGTTSWLDNGKIRVSYLPDSVFDSLLFYGTTTGDVAASGPRLILAEALIAAKGAADTADRSMVGYYWVITTAGTITGLTGIQDTITSNQYATLQFRPQDAGSSGTANTSSGSLEVGDWFVIEKVEGAGTVGSPWVFTASVINNSYELATTAVDGVVRLSSATDTSAMNGSSKVITEDVLFDVIGTAANKIAAGDHLHTGVYEPKNNGLTDLASLFTTGTAGFVRINGVNDASLDTNTYSLGTHVHGNITTDGKIGSTADLVVVTGSAGLLTTQSRSGIDSRSTFPVAVATTTVLGGITVNYSSTETNRAVTLSGNDAYVTLPRQIPAVTLNGASSTSPSFYAPTSAGLTGSTSQVKQRLNAVTGAAPTWIDAPVIYYDTTTGSTHGDIIFDEVP